MDNINSVDIIKNCCGCGGCVAVCPKEAVKITSNTEGFYERKVFVDICVNCGKCLTVCPMIMVKKKSTYNTQKMEHQTFWAAVSKNKENYIRSSSGGVFSSVAEQIIHEGGVVYGCGLDSNLIPSHMSIVSMNDIDKLRRSRYVQSDTRDTFTLIKKDLENGKHILFVGTPCQVYALKKYIGENDRLFLIDLICHGVPSPKMFADNLHYIEKKRDRKLKGYEFRLKREGSYTYTYIYTYGANEVGLYYEDAYYNSFYDFVSLNECCYSCPFANLDREGDITIGDYEWGKDHHAEFNDCSDISCILTNTKKGVNMVKKLDSSMRLTPTRIEWILEKQNNLKCPEKRPKYRDRIYKEIQQMGYEQWADKYYHSMRYFKKKPIMRPLVKMKVLLNEILKRRR